MLSQALAEIRTVGTWLRPRIPLWFHIREALVLQLHYLNNPGRDNDAFRTKLFGIDLEMMQRIVANLDRGAESRDFADLFDVFARSDQELCARPIDYEDYRRFVLGKKSKVIIDVTERNLQSLGIVVKVKDNIVVHEISSCGVRI